MIAVNLTAKIVAGIIGSVGVGGVGSTLYYFEALPVVQKVHNEDIKDMVARLQLVAASVGKNTRKRKESRFFYLHKTHEAIGLKLEEYLELCSLRKELYPKAPACPKRKPIRRR